jgi:hypothetical protein
MRKEFRVVRKGGASAPPLQKILFMNTVDPWVDGIFPSSVLS